MNKVAYTDRSAMQPAIQVRLAPPDRQEMGTGPLDGLRVLDLVGFVVGELASAVVSASGSLLADAGRKLTDVGGLLGPAKTAVNVLLMTQRPLIVDRAKATDCSPR